VRARQASIIAVATVGDRQIEEQCQHVLWVPEAPPLLQPLLTVLPLQLLSYAVALARGNDDDQPRSGRAKPAEDREKRCLRTTSDGETDERRDGQKHRRAKQQRLHVEHTVAQAIAHDGVEATLIGALGGIEEPGSISRHCFRTPMKSSQSDRVSPPVKAWWSRNPSLRPRTPLTRCSARGCLVTQVARY